MDELTAKQEDYLLESGMERLREVGDERRAQIGYVPGVSGDGWKRLPLVRIGMKWYWVDESLKEFRCVDDPGDRIGFCEDEDVYVAVGGEGVKQILEERARKRVAEKLAREWFAGCTDRGDD